ncbi:MAG: hypothetical protein ABIB43_03670 [archaeon]
MEKGQVSMEFLMVTGFAFLLIVPVLILFLTHTQDLNEDITAVQITKLGKELVDAADNVYYLGQPTKKTIQIYIPKFVESVEFIDNQIIISVDTGAISYTSIEIAASNITGSVVTNPGLHSIEIIAQSNSVIIQEAS